ncbi:MAG: Flp pilus assembly protein CpaB [Alphaproteobacteria bacterium]|nr:Flp pilus assembly protein CpaB [Alphaproteobacteria bacterium]
MNRSVLMVMGGALMVAIVVALIVQAKVSPKGPAKADTSAQVLVANKQMLIGEKLKNENVHWEPWPSGGMYSGVYKREDYADGKMPEIFDTPLRRTVEGGEPITRQALIPDVKGGKNFLAATISPGMRAVGLRINDVTSVGGFVAPGDNVDIILSYQANLPGPTQAVGEVLIGRFASQTVLSNVKVMAVDQSFKDEGREAKIAKVVTVEVTREGAEVLALAAQMGELSLALRRIGEKDTAESVVTPLTTEAGTSEVIRKLNQVMTTGGPAATVRVYNGNTVQNVPVRAAGQQGGNP